MEIKVDQNKCIGCGMCSALCPHCFEIIEGKSHYQEGLETCGCDLDEVILMCPVGCIQITK